MRDSTFGGVASEDSCDGAWVGGVASEDSWDVTSSGSRMIARTEMQTSECGGSASLVCQYPEEQVLPALGVATTLVVTHPD